MPLLFPFDQECVTRKKCATRQFTLSKLAYRWLVAGVFAIAILPSQAQAKELTRSVTRVFSPESFDQDEPWGDRTEVSSLPSGFTTLITMPSDMVMAENRPSVPFATVFSSDAAYAPSYYVMVENARAAALNGGAGLIQTSGGAAVKTVFPNVPFSLLATPALAALMKVDNAADLAKMAATSETSSSSSSFLEQLPVPEPGTIGLVGISVVAFAGFLRRGSLN